MTDAQSTAPTRKAPRRQKRSALLDAAAALDLVALQWRVTVRPDEAADLVGALRDYNGATRRVLARLIIGVDAVIPGSDYGPANPNTGRMHHEYSIGREFSRVLYVEVNKTYLPTGFDCAALAARLDGLAREAGAD